MNILIPAVTSVPSAEFGVLVAAMIGGTIVVFGLVVERLAEWLDDRFIPQYRAHKCLEDFGLGLVVLGILWEIAIGGWAANDAWQTKQMTMENDPLNQPIARISAIVSFRVKETSLSENPIWGNPTRVATVMCCESNLVLGKEVVLTSQMDFLDAGKFDRYGDEKGAQYVLHFYEQTDTEPFDPLDKELAGRRVGWVVDKIHFLDIETKFLPPDAVVLDGQAVLTVNDRQKWFNIPAQRDLNPAAGRIGFGYVVVASDETTPSSDKANIVGLAAK